MSKRKIVEIEDVISKEVDIKINEEELSRLQKKYDPDKELNIEISDDIVYEFEKSDAYYDLLNELVDKRYYKKLKIMEMNDNNTKSDKCIVEYDKPKSENLCDFKKDLIDCIKYKDKKFDVTECIIDDKEIMIKTYFFDSEMVVVVDEQTETNKLGDKTIKYYWLIAIKVIILFKLNIINKQY